MKNLIIWLRNQMMLAEALQQAGAEPYERTDARKAHRNGYMNRSLKTLYGNTVLQCHQPDEEANKATRNDNGRFSCFGE